ncbi:hypothetical protein JOF56_007875 [Kibdelosporangium banguiense]|uniref:DUF4232 domain-containing protein n=1 Tax=Kibdelosporangium banguiense TaxID=1365924 RepID=A0ABS4TSV5_9PSEU|nr:DUF4232 domain-containing protein [Kibdelosporangium banguiense]MBP2327490.1 hypothetical protein [Kibdelosporangium banguiense]
MRPLIILTVLLLTACTPAPAPAPDPIRPPTPTTTPQQQSGLMITAGEVEAASGLRAMTVTMTNKDTRPHPLNGYPALQVLDSDRGLLQIEIVPGAAGITSGFDTPPRPVTLEPGQKATASLLWRNTVTDSTVNATKGTYLNIAPADGQPWQTLQPDGGLDLGNTGKLGVSAWITP